LTASKEVILSAGSIGTPSILLHSGIGDRVDLHALNISTILHNPSVGRNLSDHTAFAIIFALASNSIDLGPWDKWVFSFGYYLERNSHLMHTSLSSDPTLQDRALELWETNRTGPYVRFVPFNQIAYTRFPNDSVIITRFGDPSSGENSAHLEIGLGVSERLLSSVTIDDLISW
jgi:choline dehydrogenase